MAKATKKISITAPKCAALAMAKLIGTYDDQNNKFQKLDYRHRKHGGDYACFDSAALDAYRMARLASKALALTPANSLGGALAKIIMAIEELEQEIDELGGGGYRTETAIFQSRLLMEDALAFIGKSYNVTPESVSMHHIYNRHLEPLRSLSEAEEAAKAMPEHQP
jgi:hypothetical protein